MTEDRPVADGIVEKPPDGSTQVRFVRRLPHPIARVSAALTDPAELRRWGGDTDLDLTHGGRFTLRWFNTDTGSDDPGAPTTLTWELDPDGDHTLLRFTNTVTQPTGTPSPDGATEGPTTADTRAAAGCHMHLDALATILFGGEVDLAHPERVYEPIHQAYTEKYGAPPE